jgi:hypothetical protein
VDTADTNTNGIPDFIERAGECADSVWHYQIEVLGYLLPPGDGTLGGGENVHDIYFKAMQLYGYTSPELPGPAPWDDYSSYCVSSARFESAAPNDDPEGQVIGALKVTLAHEFFHCIHYGYNGWVESWLMEMSSTWMEEVVFPEVNDNYQYLPSFFEAPHEGLQHDGTHRYGSFVWPRFLEENFGIDIMRPIWHNVRYNSAFAAMAAALDSIGTPFAKAFADFQNWNYLTGSRSEAGYYTDAAAYPEVAVMRTHSVIPDSNHYSVDPPEPLAGNFIVIENPGDLTGIFTFALDGNPLVSWAAGYLADYGGNDYRDTIWTSFSNGEGRIFVEYFEDVERVIVAPVVTSSYGEVYNFFYDIYLRSPGDADANDLVNISDVIFIIAYIFGSGPASHPLAGMDADCNRIVNISDAVYLVHYIFGGGPEPCADAT